MGTVQVSCSSGLHVPQPWPMEQPTFLHLPIFATVVPLPSCRQPPQCRIVLLMLTVTGWFSRNLSVPQPSPMAEPTMARLPIFATVVAHPSGRQPPQCRIVLLMLTVTGGFLKCLSVPQPKAT